MSKSENVFERIADKFNVDTQIDIEHKESLRRQMLDTFNGPSQETHESENSTPIKGRALVMIRIAQIAAVLILVTGLFFVSELFDDEAGSGGGIAFGEVMEKFYRAESYHIKMVSGGKVGHIWAKRPDKMLFEEVKDKEYLISNGKDSWAVDIPNKKVIKRPSSLYLRAQRLKIDVIDILVTPSNDRLSGFYSENPVAQVTIDGVLYDKYKTAVTDSNSETHFEALVNAESQFLYWMKLEIQQKERQKQEHEITILEYNIDIPDEKFEFTCPEGLELVTEEPKETETKPENIPPEQTVNGGSTISGRIVWAHTGKPVGSARIELDSDGPAFHNMEFIKNFSRITVTNSEGYWECTGLPTMVATLRVRSWSKGWPAMPEFDNNIGSLKKPKVGIDGKSNYNDLNFKVHKPQGVYSRIKIHFTDENGDPIEGVDASLESPNGCSEYSENLLTPHPDHQPVYSDSHGDLVAKEVWPTSKPVRIRIFSPPKDRPNLIHRKIYSRDLFTVGINQDYHFNIVIPCPRTMMIQVVDTDGNPLEGISLKVWSKEHCLFQFYPDRWGKVPPLLTDAKGLAEIENLCPGESIVVLAECIDKSNKPALSAELKFEYPGQDVLYAACKQFNAPDDMNDIPIYQFIMEKKPSLVKCSGFSGDQYRNVWSRSFRWRCLVTGEYNRPGNGPLNHYKYKDEYYRLVPSGDISIQHEFNNIATGEVKYFGMNLHTEPGMIYEIVLTEDGGKIISSKRIE